MSGGGGGSEEKKASDAVREMAGRIYVELVARGTHLTESSVKMDTAPENLVKLSFRVAEAFHTVAEELAASKKPKTTFKLEASNIDEWMK